MCTLAPDPELGFCYGALESFSTNLPQKIEILYSTHVGISSFTYGEWRHDVHIAKVGLVVKIQRYISSTSQYHIFAITHHHYSNFRYYIKISKLEVQIDKFNQKTNICKGKFAIQQHIIHLGIIKLGETSLSTPYSTD